MPHQIPSALFAIYHFQPSYHSTLHNLPYILKTSLNKPRIMVVNESYFQDEFNMKGNTWSLTQGI
jgi:hypothetical protein